MKYVVVDFYGKCFYNKDFLEFMRIVEDLFEVEEFLDFIVYYKFYIVFENVICRDYMIEKLMWVLYVGFILIYFGLLVV